MKTYRNEQFGFEIDLPEDWSLPTGGALDDIRCLPDEAIDFAISPQLLELLSDYIEREFTQIAQGKGYTNLAFGRISAGGKEHVWASYCRGRGEWTKKYMLAFGGVQYVITATGANPTTFVQREQVWDAMVSSFRLCEWRKQEIAKQQADRSESAGQLYQRAYEAVGKGRYSDACALLEQCLSDNPNHILAHKELAVVLKKMGDMRGALFHRREVKRLDPSDTVNRFNLADLLAVLGARDDALREVEDLLVIDPYHSAFQALKMALMDNPLTYPQHYYEESQKHPGKERNLRLIASSVEGGKNLTLIRLIYQFDRTLSHEEVFALDLRARAYIACAIYDAAKSAGLLCHAFEIPHGRRPSWLIGEEKIPISLTNAALSFQDQMCIIEIGPSVLTPGRPQGGGTHWAKLLEGFKSTFSNISI